MTIEQLEAPIAEIKRISFSDDKTSLGNALLLAQEERSVETGASEFDVVVFGDLNDFKHLNDDCGHEAGDLAINKVGEAIHKIVVGGLRAKAFRASGDEFVILLKRDLVKEFLALASSFSNILFTHKEQELRTAMSLGYVVSDGKTSFRDLLGRAEVACQFAKRMGDGTCVEWTEDMNTNPLKRVVENCPKCSARISCNTPSVSAPAKLKCCPCCGEQF